MEHPNPKLHWFVRRTTMLVSLALAVLTTISAVILEIGNPGIVQSLSPALGWHYTALTAPVLGYYGNTAVEEWSRSKPK